MEDVSVIIVSWNASAYLQKCLRSIQETAESHVHEVIVVDNGSTDDSCEMAMRLFPRLKLIQTGKNLGFAKANNIGIKIAKGKILALINSDVVVHPNCFQQLIRLINSDPKIGLVGPKIIGRDGLLQRTCGRFPTVWNTACHFLLLDKAFPKWSLFAGFEGRDDDHNTCIEAEVLSGCFWMARREAVDEIGGLDERFFFYAEDVDWCKRFKAAHWKTIFFPDATATHFGGGSSSNVPLRFCVEMLRANLAYWQKHHGTWGRYTYFVLALAQHTMRFCVRGFLDIFGLAKEDENKQQLAKHWVSIRWLLTGKSS